MDDQQAHQTRQIHAVESAVGLVASPFVYHAGGSMVSQEQKMAAHYDAALQIQHQQMHQHIAAVSHMQQAAQIIPQMIHITGQQMRDVQAMRLQDQSYQFFQPLPLSNTMQMGRVEDMHRPASLSYPINTIFGNTEDKNNCCLLDRGTRCSRAAGTAGFTHRIRELVTRSGALLSEDANAGHQYICDHHKNYIQKLRVILPPGTYVPPNMGHGAGVPSFFSPFASFASPYTVESMIQQSSNSNVPTESDDFTGGDGVGRTATPNRTNTASAQPKKKDGFSEANSPPLDMRKFHSATEVRQRAVSVSPEKEEESEESSDESEGSPPASDLVYGLSDVFTMEDLINYAKHFEIDLPSRPTKDELYRILCEHMDTVPVSDIQTTLTSFFHAVKTDTRAFNQPHKQSLSVDFDLSSDEEMILIDGKTAVLNGETASVQSDTHSESDADEDLDNGEDLPQIHFDAEVQRALTEINGNIPVSEIERILLRYAMPTKHRLACQESDTESSSGDERKPAKRSSGHVKKRQRMRNSSD